MSDDNVIDFAEARKRVLAGGTLSTMRAIDKTGQVCQHKHVVVGEDFGDVECGDCKVRLQAHAVLLQFAHEERNFWFTNKIAIDELERITKSIAALKAEEKRLKSRVKRARETVSKGEVQIFARSMADKPRRRRAMTCTAPGCPHTATKRVTGRDHDGQAFVEHVCAFHADYLAEHDDNETHVEVEALS